MNKQEVSLLLAKASAAFPRTAPNFKDNPGIFGLWCEMLQDIEPQRALANLNEHIRNKNFFPDIADIVRADLLSSPDHEQNRLQTTELLAIKDSWHEEATPPPKHVTERWGRK